MIKYKLIKIIPSVNLQLKNELIIKGHVVHNDLNIQKTETSNYIYKMQIIHVYKPEKEAEYDTCFLSMKHFQTSFSKYFA